MTLTILDWLDAVIMSTSAVMVFLCRYRKRRDAAVGTLLFICLVYQVYETLTGTRLSAISDVLFDAVFFVILLSAGGNIMTVMVYGGLCRRWRRLRALFSWVHIRALLRGHHENKR